MAPVTAVKMGKNGAELWSDQGHITSAVERVSVKDTTGAGDAFNGGFLNRWIDGAPLQACLEAGNACGVISVQHEGGIGGVPHLKHASAAPSLDMVT